MATVTAPLRASASAHPERGFFVVMAGAAVVVALFGFSARYFVPMAAGSLHLPRLVHIHGLLMWSWTVLFFAQSWLAYTGQLRRHRAFGMLGIAILTLCVWTGASVAILQLDQRLASGIGDGARAFALMPMSLVFTMPVLFAAAILQARKPEAHARLMLLVTLVALNPAWARIVGMAAGTMPGRNATAGGIIVLATIAIGIAYDRLRRGAVHPAYLYGGGFVLVVYALRTTLNQSDAWYAATDALVSLAH